MSQEREKGLDNIELILENLPEKDYKQVWRILYGNGTRKLDLSEKCLKLAQRYKLELISCHFHNSREEQLRPARIVRVGLFQQKLPLPLSNPIRKVKTAMYTLAMDAIKVAAKGVLRYFVCNKLGLAKENKMIIISTILEREESFEGDRIWNTAVIIDNHGNCLGKYRGNHIPKVENANEPTYYCEGNTGHPVFQTEYGRIAVNICYGRHHPLSWTGFALNGAEIVFNPCSAVGEQFETLWSIEARNAAIANGYYVCAVNRVGMEIYEHEYEDKDGNKVLHKDSGHFFGSTYVSAPDGSRSQGLSRIKNGLLITEMDLNMCRQVKDDRGFGVTQRLELYKDVLSRITKKWK